MAIGITPIVGNWYQGTDELKFEVVKLDEDTGIIDIRYFDGELDEVELDVWSQMKVEHISSPGDCEGCRDWTGIYDEFSQDDLDYIDSNFR